MDFSEPFPEQWNRWILRRCDRDAKPKGFNTENTEGAEKIHPKIIRMIVMPRVLILFLTLMPLVSHLLFLLLLCALCVLCVKTLFSRRAGSDLAARAKLNPVSIMTFASESNGCSAWDCLSLSWPPPRFSAR